jgi:hypothetical protein
MRTLRNANLRAPRLPRRLLVVRVARAQVAVVGITPVGKRGLLDSLPEAVQRPIVGVKGAGNLAAGQNNCPPSGTSPYQSKGHGETVAAAR